MKAKVSEIFFYISKAVNIVYRSSPKWTFINAFLVFLRGAIPLLLLFVVKQLIDVVGGFVQKGNVNYDLTNIYITIALVGMFFLLNAITSSISVLVKERQSYSVNDYIQRLIHDKTVKLPYGYFEDSNYQDIFFRALNEATYRPASIFYGVLGILQNAITLSLIIVVLTSLHWWLIPVILGAALPIIIFRFYYSLKIYTLRKEQTEDERRVFYLNRLLTTKDYAKELRIFNLGATFLQLFESKRNELRSKQWKVLLTKSIWELGVQVFSTASLLLVFTFVIFEAINGRISNGMMAMYFLALQRGYGVLQELMQRINTLYEDNLFLKNFFEFQKIEISEGERSEKNFPKPLVEGIHFNNVGFKYPNANKWVLRNVNFTIPVGKTVALVGANGSGKTTMVKLLTGLYAPEEGSIQIDSTNLSLLSQKEMADNISVIYQDFMLYNVSASDNIRYGNVKRQFVNSDVEEAAKDAGIHELFEGLGNGYDTILGTLFKGSEQLSQGEWQRTALARSFYNQAQIIILDEPTSSLDAFTEANLISHFKEITKGRTAIIVSHRLSTIKLADLIIVLNKEGVEEIGSAQELIAKQGLYYQMVESLK